MSAHRVSFVLPEDAPPGRHREDGAEFLAFLASVSAMGAIPCI